VPKAIVDALGDRVGRYPSQRDGGCAWRGVIMDSNPPDDDHWLYRLAEVERPDGWMFFKQPGGLIETPEGKFLANPAAENLGNLEPNYYETRMAGKSADHVRVYYCAQYGYVREGKPVIPEYVDKVHCADALVQPVGSADLHIGLDFGLTPAAVFGQRLGSGRIVWIDELVTEDMGAVRFGELLKAKIQADYPSFLLRPGGIVITGDPAGEQRVQTDERTPYQILNKILEPLGIEATPAHSNDPTLRREAIATPLSRIIDGSPGLMVSPKCVVTRKGLGGGYCYRRLQVAGDERYADRPEKNKYSHPVDAGGYMMLGMGEGTALTVTARPRRTVGDIMATMHF
jgi:hypothetical protein